MLLGTEPIRRSYLEGWKNLWTPLGEYVEDFEFGDPWFKTTEQRTLGAHDWSPDNKYWAIPTGEEQIL